MKENLSPPLDAIVFDCDGTLTSLEGIDELARMNGVGEQVERLTAEAMGGSGMNPELFRRRLEIVKPSFAQVDDLAYHYFHYKTPDIFSVLNAFRLLKKPVYIVSAGLYPAVQAFGEMLSIPASQIFAVNIYFDEAGNYFDFDSDSPLVYADGKRSIVKDLCHRHPRLAYIGDGMNDLAVYDLVSRFIGYGGAFYRENIAKRCQYYISTPSMSPLLPLSLTPDELKTALASFDNSTMPG
jgi:phosphoserine phosphatase